MTRHLRVFVTVAAMLVAALLSLTATVSAQGTTVVPVMPTVNGQVCDRNTGNVSAPNVVFVDSGSGIEYYDISVSGIQSVYESMQVTAYAKLPAGKSWGDLPTGETQIATNNGYLVGKWSNPWGGDPQGEYLTFSGKLYQDFCRIQLILVPDLPTVVDYTCKNGFLAPVVKLPDNSEYIDYEMGDPFGSANFQVVARKSDAAYALPPLKYDIIWQLPQGNEWGEWMQFDPNSNPFFDGSTQRTPCDSGDPTVPPHGLYICTLRFDQSIHDWRVASVSPSYAYVMGWIGWSDALNDYVLPGNTDKYSWCDKVPDGWVGDETPIVTTETPGATQSPVVTETPSVTQTPAPNAFTLTSTARSCDDQSFSATWSGANIATIEFALSNTSDNWTSGWLTADPAKGSFSTAVDHHGYDKVAALVTFTDGNTQTAMDDVGACTEAPTIPEKPTTPSNSGGSVTSLPSTGAGDNEGISYAGLIAATTILMAAIGGVGVRRQHR